MFKITSIIIVRHKTGPDHVMLKTDLPSAMPYLGTDDQYVSFHAERGTGVDYCIDTFGIRPEVIES